MTRRLVVGSLILALTSLAGCGAMDQAPNTVPMVGDDGGIEFDFDSKRTVTKTVVVPPPKAPAPRPPAPKPPAPKK